MLQVFKVKKEAKAKVKVKASKTAAKVWSVQERSPVSSLATSCTELTKRSERCDAARPKPRAQQR